MEAPKKLYLISDEDDIILSYDPSAKLQFGNRYDFVDKEVFPIEEESEIEYIRKDALIEKACDAYCKVCGHYPHTVPTHICRKNCDYFSDFKSIWRTDYEEVFVINISFMCDIVCSFLAFIGTERCVDIY